jgi:hypothetical protein
MARPLIGRTIRRLRMERGLTQQALAARLGISASYLNLIEHDQRSVTASLLIKLGENLAVDLPALSGNRERQVEAGLREVLADPLLGLDEVPENEVATLAASAPNAARAMLALYRAWRVAKEDASGIALPTGRRMLLPTEEARDFFHDHANHFPALEAIAERIGAELRASPAEMNHAIAERLRRTHGVTVAVGKLDSALRRYDPQLRRLDLSESLPRESRGFQMAFQLMLLEARDAVEAVVAPAEPSTADAAALIRLGLLNYAAAALLMPYLPFLSAARELRHEVEALAARFGGSCPKWIVHRAFAHPGETQVQVAQLPDGATFLTFARAIAAPTTRWGEPAPMHVVAMGCDIGRAAEIAYADGIEIGTAAVGIGLSCRLCDRADCRSRAFPPLEHRLTLDPNEDSAAPWRFEAAPGTARPPAKPRA